MEICFHKTNVGIGSVWRGVGEVITTVRTAKSAATNSQRFINILNHSCFPLSGCFFSHSPLNLVHFGPQISIPAIFFAQ